MNLAQILRLQKHIAKNELSTYAVVIPENPKPKTSNCLLVNTYYGLILPSQSARQEFESFLREHNADSLRDSTKVPIGDLYHATRVLEQKYGATYGMLITGESVRLTFEPQQLVKFKHDLYKGKVCLL
jgi:hypothetical protein